MAAVDLRRIAGPDAHDVPGFAADRDRPADGHHTLLDPAVDDHRAAQGEHVVLDLARGNDDVLLEGEALPGGGRGDGEGQREESGDR